MRKQEGRVRFSDGCAWIAGDRISTSAATFVNFEHVPGAMLGSHCRLSLHDIRDIYMLATS